MSLTLFPDAGVPQGARPPRKGKRAAAAPPPAPVLPPAPAPLRYEPMPEQCGIEAAAPARPEILSAQYWFEQKRRADRPERKAECHRNMIASLLAIDRGARLQ